MAMELEGKTATLLQDGWSNIHNQPIIANCLVVEGKAYFLNSIDTGSLSKTAENCKQICKDAMDLTKEKFGCNVRSVCTDNAKNMEKMRAALEQEDSGLITYGCASHWLNLLGHDLTKSNVMKQIVEVQKYFRNHHKPNAWLEEQINSVKPQIPGDTRWNSNLDCLDTFIGNRSAYANIALEHENDIENSIIRKIQDVSLYKSAKDMADQLRPVAQAIDVCQTDFLSIATACHTLLSLLEEPALQTQFPAIQKRCKQIILVPQVQGCTTASRTTGIC